ncbi:MAG TPA: hypothetical protein VND98_03725 [Solirubrobacterales bacterium]|nr:hypothetical protein [Solirubrobacterales bacterium]
MPDLVVGEPEEGGPDRVVTSPAAGDVEGPPAGDIRFALEQLLDHGEAARRRLEAIVGAGDKAVQRHR